MRRTVEVVAISDETVCELLVLWSASKAEAGMDTECAAKSAAEARLVGALSRPEVRAYLARSDGRPVGYAVTSQNVFGLSPSPELAIEQLYVDPATRHQGVAKALLAAVVAHAERAGCDVIVGNVPSQSRDANRFFARLGFSSILVRRVTSTATLHKRLAAETSHPAIEQLLRRRRSLRAVTGRARSA